MGWDSSYPVRYGRGANWFSEPRKIEHEGYGEGDGEEPIQRFRLSPMLANAAYRG